jgi:hypothetical protein
MELEKRAEQVLPGRETFQVLVGGERKGVGGMGRNVPNNVCTCE